MTNKKQSVKEITIRRVNEVINEFDELSDELKKALIEAIATKTATSAQHQKIVDDNVFDAYLKIYIHQKHFKTKKVKLKSGEIVERFQSTTLATARLQAKIRKAHVDMNEQIVTIMLSKETQKEKIKKVTEMQETLDITEAKEIELLKASFLKDNK